MVDTDYKALEFKAQQETDKGHQRLKATEVYAHGEYVLRPHLFNGKSLTYRYRESVHTQRQGDKKQIKKAQLFLHLIFSDIMKIYNNPLSLSRNVFLDI